MQKMKVRNVFGALLLGGIVQMADAANLAIKPFQTPTAIVGEKVSLQVEAEGGVPPYVFEVVGSSHPLGFSYSVSVSGLLSVDALSNSANCFSAGSHSGYSLKVTDSLGAVVDQILAYSVWVSPSPSILLKWRRSPVDGKYNAEINLSCGSAAFVNGASTSLNGGNIPPSVAVQYVSPLIMYFSSSEPVQFDLDVDYNFGLHPNSKIGQMRYSFIKPDEVAGPAPVPASSTWALLAVAGFIGWIALRKLRCRGA